MLALSTRRSLLLLPLLAAPVAGQSPQAPARAALRPPHAARLDPEATRNPAAENSALSSRWQPEIGPPFSPDEPLSPEEAEALGVLVRPTAPAVEREDLEGAAEGAHRFNAVPGGILLGRAAEGVPAGARLALLGRGRLGLSFADGRSAPLPPADAALLRAALDFALQPDGSDVVISLTGTIKTEISPAFATSPVGPALERADRAPHALLPSTRSGKSAIVDRAVRVLVDGSELALEADLEVRTYEPAESLLVSGLSRRTDTLVLLDGSLGLHPEAYGPPTADLATLARELEIVSELAGWVGLFRRLAAEEPAGLQELRTRL